MSVWYKSLTAFFSGLVCLCLLPAMVSARQPGTRSGNLHGIKNFTRHVMDTWHVPGLALVVVKGDSTLISQGFGVRETGTSDTVDTQTMFAIGSASKAFTVTALGMLEDENRLSFSKPVQNFFPSFRLRDPWVSRHITLTDMLSHRTGVKGRDILWVWKENVLTRGDLVSCLAQCPEDLPFRAGWDYNNLMYLCAGQIIPEVTEQTWDTFINQRIFTPLGMTDSNTSVFDLKGSNVAHPHVLENGIPHAISYRNIDNIAPAGAINSNILDMEKWLRFQLDEGVSHNSTRLITRKALANMRTPHFAFPFPPGGSPAFPHAHMTGYGLGWFLHDYHGEYVVEHGGNIDGMTALVAMIPAKKIGLVILSNMQGSRIREVLMYHIFDQLLGHAPEDWNGYFKNLEIRQNIGFEKKRKGIISRRVADIRPTLGLLNYAGTYANTIFGKVLIGIDTSGQGLFMTYLSRTVPLEHWQGDTFKRPFYSIEEPGIELIHFHLKQGKITAFDDDVMGRFTRVP